MAIGPDAYMPTKASYWGELWQRDREQHQKLVAHLEAQKVEISLNADQRLERLTLKDLNFAIASVPIETGLGFDCLEPGLLGGC